MPCSARSRKWARCALYVELDGTTMCGKPWWRAARAFRSDLFAHGGPLISNREGYEGPPLLAYSLLSPVFGGLIGTRLVAALCTLGAVVVLERTLVPRYGTAGRIAAVLFALTAG